MQIMSTRNPPCKLRTAECKLKVGAHSCILLFSSHEVRHCAKEKEEKKTPNNPKPKRKPIQYVKKNLYVYFLSCRIESEKCLSLISAIPQARELHSSKPLRLE